MKTKLTILSCIAASIFVNLIFYNKGNAQEINPKSGFYSDSIQVEIKNIPESYHVFYTLDGKTPNTESSSYSSPFTINQTTALTVASISEDLQDTIFTFRSYLMNEPTELPVVTLTSDPDHFFSDETGIYVTGTNGVTGYCSSVPRNWNQEEWEHPVHVEYFEKDRSKGFSINAGVRITGGCTRLYDEKSLGLYFRKEYGEKRLNYPLFKDKNVTSFKRLVLRNGGQDWYRALIRNEAIQSIVRNRIDVGYQANIPVVVFLNGQYWGIHILIEKKNEDFIESNYGFDADSIDILKDNGTIVEGNADHYNTMIQFLSTHDLSVQENFDWVAEQMDVLQFADYQITEIFTGNGDWPANNTRFWRPQRPDGKWRWIMFDMDMALGVHSRGMVNTNSLYIATSPNNDYDTNPAWSTLILRKLLENQGFKQTFIQRYNIYMQTVFQRDRMQAFFDSTAALIASEVPAHTQRWTKSLRLGADWQGHLSIIRDFIKDRESYARPDLEHFFNVGNRKKLDLEVASGEGFVLVENQVIQPENGIYLYPGISTRIKAVPAQGYTFSGWDGDISGNDADYVFNPEASRSLIKAHFTRNTAQTQKIVINEINYKSASSMNVGDWVEFYNHSGNDIDISGWYFSDEKDSHKFFFPENTILKADSYLVISEDTTALRSFFPQIETLLGNVDFGLSSDGELVRLFNNNDEIVNALTYGNSTPWPADANGLGATLALVNPGFDNTDGSNWAASYNGGTPGTKNTDIFVSNEREIHPSKPKGIRLDQNFPNPFNPSTTISYSIPENGQVKLNIYSITGQKIAVLINEMQKAGSYQVNWNSEPYSVSSGIYFYRLEVNGTSLTRKLTLIK